MRNCRHWPELGNSMASSAPAAMQRRTVTGSTRKIRATSLVVSNSSMPSELGFMVVVIGLFSFLFGCFQPLHYSLYVFVFFGYEHERRAFLLNQRHIER